MTLFRDIRPILLAAMLGIAALDAAELYGQDSTSSTAGGVFEWFPILMYDTDVGFGAGGKVIFLDYLGGRESFKLTAFASTKGERWLRLEHSWADTELRQGTVYPVALDVVADYDKMIHNNFFGVGNDSRYEDRETYTREPLDLQLRASRGFTPTLVGQVFVRYLQVWSSGFDETGMLRGDPRSTTNGRTLSGGLLLRYDTRDSYVHPQSGFVVQGEVDYAPDLGALFIDAGRGSLWLQGYRELWDTRIVMAGRAGMQTIFGGEVPVQFLIPVGGNNTVRGLPQDRLLDRCAAVANVELRVPLFWRLGAIAGADAGRVWHDLRQVGLSAWTVTPVVGLRYYLEYEVVRMDVGFGPDAIGLYFNFSHVF